MCIVSTMAYEIFGYLYRGIVLTSNIEIGIFIKKLLIELLYNTLLTIIMYPLMRKLRLQNRRNIQKSADTYKIFLRFI